MVHLRPRDEKLLKLSKMKEIVIYIQKMNYKWESTKCHFIMNIIKVVQLGYTLVYILNDFELHTNKSLAIHL